MKKAVRHITAHSGLATAIFLLGSASAMPAQTASDTQAQVQQLQKQNDELRALLKQQQAAIDALTHKVSNLTSASAAQDHAVSDLQSKISASASAAPEKTGRFGNVIISGEGGVGFFKTGHEGPSPNSDFRIDEARLFLEGPVWGDVYFYTELNLAEREFPGMSPQLGEAYIDWEHASQLWGDDHALNIRAGRFYIPFGEEYQYRFAVDNPLISHSVSDLWGESEGIQLYGSAGKFHYNVAVQNGSQVSDEPFSSDKSVVARLAYDPAPWLHVSVSGMRTGDISAPGFNISDIWFGGGWFRSIGSTNTTAFHANLAEGDIRMKFGHSQFNAAGGYINYRDNDSPAANHRDLYYYYAEAVQPVWDKLYAAARYSQVFARGGYPIVGGGTMSDYFYSPTLTDDYWRLSLGLGYRFNKNLLLKAEYSFNHGREQGGDTRVNENSLALEAAFGF